jgi:excisionase family DNA binding protein
LSRRRRSLQAPSGLGLAPALACGSGSAPAVRRISAAIEAGQEPKPDENRRADTKGKAMRSALAKDETVKEAPRPRPGGALLTAAQVGELLGVPKSWVYLQSREGRIPTVTLGHYRRYRAEAIERWVEELEAEGVGF